MSVVAENAKHLIDDTLARRNAMVLAVTQALAGGNNTILLATGSIAGAILAPDKTLATVPITVYVIGLWLGTLPVGWLGECTSGIGGLGWSLFPSRSRARSQTSRSDRACPC